MQRRVKSAIPSLVVNVDVVASFGFRDMDSTNESKNCNLNPLRSIGTVLLAKPL
jgi:hypothetical protein